MNSHILAALYFFALAVEISAQAAGDLSRQYFSKPSLMLILIAYYSVKTKNHPGKVKYLIIFALAFSWLGDVLLLFDKTTPSFFIYGLLAFLTAHIFYISYFLKIRKLNRVKKLPGVLICAAIAVYTFSLFVLLAPNVKSLLVPVAIYACVLAVMLAASIAAFDPGKQTFGKVCVTGTLCFLVSDSILAINRFAAPFAAAPVFVMATYGAAQFLIAEGSWRNLKRLAAANEEFVGQ